MIQAAIIDDEVPSVKLLSHLLKRYFPGVKVKGSAVNARTARELLQAPLPELLFLDVELSGQDGFSLLASYPEAPFKVILISGYHAKDLEGRDPRIVAVLEKPLVLDELRIALQKSGLPFEKEPEGLVLRQNAAASERYPFEKILFIEAQRAYALIHFVDGQQKLASQPLSDLEKVAPSYFYRCHKSYLVNAKQVAEVAPGRGGKIRLQEGLELPLAYRRKADFLSFLQKL